MDGVTHINGASSAAFGGGYSTIELVPVTDYQEQVIYVRSHSSAIRVVW